MENYTGEFDKERSADDLINDIEATLLVLFEVGELTEGEIKRGLAYTNEKPGDPNVVVGEWNDSKKGRTRKIIHTQK